MLWEMYCVVQGQGRTANTFHELLKEQTWKGEKNAAWPLSVDWTCGLHGIQFPSQ